MRGHRLFALELQGGGDNRRKRRAQLVTEHGEELILREVGTRLFLKFLVGILKFGCERLGLSEQVLRSGVRFDRVQNNSDALGELVKERLMRRIKTLKRRKLHDRFDFAFKQNRQNNDVDRPRFAKAGADRGIIPRHIAQENPLFLQGGLPNQTFAEFETDSVFSPIVTGIAGEELKLRFLL